MHVRSFVDEDLLIAPPRTNPAIFVHDGQWLLGGGTGKATLWHVDSGGQFQSLVITGFFHRLLSYLCGTDCVLIGLTSPVNILAVCLLGEGTSLELTDISRQTRASLH